MCAQRGGWQAQLAQATVLVCVGAHHTIRQRPDVCSKFGVSGIPMLVVLKPDGTIACGNGRGDLQSSGDMAAALAAWGL